MKTKSTSAEILMIAVTLAPLVYLGIVWNQLPAEIATHFDLQGNPNGWSSKKTLVLEMGGLSVILYLLLRFLPNIDPKGQLQTSNYQKIRFIATLLQASVFGWLAYKATNLDHSSGREEMSLVMAFVGLLIAGMGNYMMTVKPNYFVGIRTPWTLQNEAVWRKTHRMGGQLMVAGGLLSSLLALIVPMPYKVGCFVGIILLTTLIPVMYSYIYFQQEKAHQLN